MIPFFNIHMQFVAYEYYHTNFSYAISCKAMISFNDGSRARNLVLYPEASS